jgi:ABC-type nitrate/sulfonate/bicarbonate transport system ATPase subunit
MPEYVKQIQGISLEVEDDALVMFVGPSGFGKSTLLRIETKAGDLGTVLELMSAGT